MEIEKILCTGCSACFSVCKKDAISFSIDNNSFYKPTINDNKCIKCGLCEKVCPQIQLNNKPQNSQIPNSYLVINTTESDRMISSSGGVFIALAKQLLNKGNCIVFGASFDENWNVIHQGIEDISDLYKITRSKYVQSFMGNVFNKVKINLDENKTVVFCGTSCQIAGLKLYLRKEYDNLITIDFICHGIPSPLLWKKYLQSFMHKRRCNIEQLHFRGKNLGWHKHSLYIKYGKHEYEVDRRDNPYMQFFLKDISLNDCCYNCNFKRLSRLSDITLADFWGVETEYPEYDDNKGTSFVLTHTIKGDNCINSLENCFIKKVPIESGLRHNLSLISSVRKPSIRNEFVIDLQKHNFNFLVRKYLKFSLIIRIKNYAKKIIKRG